MEPVRRPIALTCRSVMRSKAIGRAFKPAFFLALGLLAVACGREKDDHIADEVPVEAAPPAPADTGTVEDPEYEKRVASMASYEDCMRQTVGLEARHAEIIKKACATRRNAPK